MAGYIRTDTTDEIANGNTVDAIPLDTEFDAIQGAFAAVGGHNHDGAVGEGAPIVVVGPAQDVVISGNSVTPKTDNTVDLGSATFEFKDLWIDGTANIDSLVADTADINGGTVDATVIGATTPAAATITALAATTATVGGDTVTTNAAVQTLTNKTINLASNTLVATSAQMAAAVTDETGTGALVFAGSPALTGTPTAPTAAAATDTTQIATTAHVFAERANTATLTNKTLTSPVISGGTITGITDLAIADGGTGASTAAGALTNLGLTATAAELNFNSGVTSAVQTQLNAKQPLDATLTALASYNSNGILTQTAADTFTARSVDGTANQITVTNGNGVSGNPTISAVIASQAEAELGTDNTKLVTPLRVSQAITALASTNFNEQIFTASGTWTKPASFSPNSFVIIQAWGAGGGGGRDGSAPGGSGGGGGTYVERTLRLAELGATETVTIGAGGIGRTASSGNGTDGGTTTFGALVTAYGGAGGGGGGSAAGELAGGGGGPISVGSRAGAVMGGGYKSATTEVFPNLWGGGSGGYGGGVAGAGADGQSTTYGGAGGGAGTSTASPIAGGTSLFGGAGGTGGDGSPAATAGTAPAGGGGGGVGSNGADGARGEVRVRVYG